MTLTNPLFKTLLQLLFLSFIVSFALGVNYLLAWTGPTGAPPNNNAPAPINVSTQNQAKLASLSVGKVTPTATDYGLISYGRVRSTIGGVEFPDGTVQVSAGGGGSLSAIRSYTSSGTWTKPAGLSYVVVEVWGGGGGGKGYIANNGATGGTSSFGSHMSATGGAGAQTPSGVGSGGDINLTGGGGTAVNSLSTITYGTGGHGGDAPRGGSGGSGTFGPTSGLAGKVPGGGGGGAGSANGSNQATGGSAGGYSMKRISAASLGATESITIGAGGAGGVHATASGGAGAAGMVVIYEY